MFHHMFIKPFRLHNGSLTQSMHQSEIKAIQSLSWNEEGYFLQTLSMLAVEAQLITMIFFQDDSMHWLYPGRKRTIETL